MWSTMRGHFAPIQDLSGQGTNVLGNQSVWLVYQNQNTSQRYQFNCSDNDTALISPFDVGTTVKNLFYPHDEIVLEKGPKKLGIYGSEKFNGCLRELDMAPFEFRAYVPKASFTQIDPVITKFVPGHDARLVSTVNVGQQEDVRIEFYFSSQMDCDEIGSKMVINSKTEDGRKARLDRGSIVCSPAQIVTPQFVGGIPGMWSFKAEITNVSNGVHEIILKNIHTQNQSRSTGVFISFHQPSIFM